MQENGKQEAKAKMWLADDRECFETGHYRQYKTLGFRSRPGEDQEAFGLLVAVNDHTIAPAKSISLSLQDDTFTYFLPIVGDIVCKYPGRPGKTVGPGELSAYLGDDSSVQVFNPYENELVNFLELRLRSATGQRASVSEIVAFDVDKDKNSLVSISNGVSTSTDASRSSIMLGKYGGRMDGKYEQAHRKNKLFVLIVEGVFEVMGRLLHARDCLAIWDAQGDVDFEALSNDAIILMVEQHD